MGQWGQARDREVFDALYPRLLAWVTAATGDRELAQDIAAESFARLLTRGSRVREPRPYLYTTATNLIRDEWRRRGRGQRLQQALSVLADDAIPDHDGGVRDVVERLPERQRLVVLLFYYADLTVEQVARALQLPAGTVKRQLHEARQLLALHLEANDA